MRIVLPLTRRRGGSGTELRARWRIQMVSLLGEMEKGVDIGGVFREFIDHTLRLGFGPDSGLFVTTYSNELIPNPHANQLMSSAALIEVYTFLGLLVAKGIYEGVVMDLPLSRVFVANILMRKSTVDDLREIDEPLYRSLLQLPQIENVGDLGLTFCIEETFLGKVTNTELIAGGADIAVTNENVVQYIRLVCDYKLTTGTMQATLAFKSGMEEILESSWLSTFSLTEFQQLVRGTSARISISDFKDNIKLIGYETGSLTIKLLCECISTMSDEDQCLFMKFCTGSRRPPLLGFSALDPPFAVQRTAPSSMRNYLVDIDTLPTASTCFNLLKLPPYRTLRNLKSKLLLAIQSQSGFDLS